MKTSECQDSKLAVADRIDTVDHASIIIFGIVWALGGVIGLAYSEKDRQALLQHKFLPNRSWIESKYNIPCNRFIGLLALVSGVLIAVTEILGRLNHS